MSEQDEKETNSLMSQSKILLGVNPWIFFGNVIICTLICINAHTFWGVPLFAVFHLLVVRFSTKGADYMYLSCNSLIKTPPLLNRYH